MQKIIYPSNRVNGSIIAPASKSYGQRVLACSLINKEKTTIFGLGNSDDEQGLFQLISEAGAEIERIDDKISIKGVELNNPRELNLNFGESGLAARMMTPILSNASFTIHLNGKGSLLNRPMSLFDELLKSLEVDFQSNFGKLPFRIVGPLKPQHIQIDGSMSSQFITGLILGYVTSPFLKNETIQVRNPTSIPYIELTLDVLRDFGVELEFENNKIHFSGPYEMKSTEILIEGDWSSASFFLVAGAILGDVTIHGLNLDSKQADRKILEALADFGAEIRLENGVQIVKKHSRAFEFDATHCPDLFPPLAVLASFGEGESKIKGVSRLIHKESNRAQTIQSELTKLGAEIYFSEDVMFIHGIEKGKAAVINPHGDHRIAMASAIMALKAEKPTTILESEVVNKSFPDFYDFLEKLL